MVQLAMGRQALEDSGLDIKEIRAIGISNQRESVVVWNRKTGLPVYNVIVWQDRRTADIIARLKDSGCESMIRKKTGLLPDPYFSATKIQWILDNDSRIRKQANRGELAAGTIDSWLVYRLTGGRVHITDITNANRTLLMNIHTGQWDEELLHLFDIPQSMLPQIKPSSSIIGESDSSFFGKSIPIAGIAGDQQAALFGQMCIRPGMVKNTYGTGCFMLMNTGSQTVESRHNLLTTTAWKIGTQSVEYALEGSVFTGGAAIRWLRDGLKIIRSSSEVNELAITVPDSCGVCVVPAFAGLGAPHWQPNARGTILGLTQGTTVAHIVRATLEGIAFQVADVLRAMEADTEESLCEIRVDGGVASSNILLQIQADILGLCVQRPVITETTALGAAYLAGLAVGVWKDTEQMANQWKIDKTFEPAISEDQRQSMLAQWNRAVKYLKEWAA